MGHLYLKKCPNCSEIIERTLDVCPVCGHAVEEAGWTCKHCGSVNLRGNIFCTRCGQHKFKSPQRIRQPYRGLYLSLSLLALLLGVIFALGVKSFDPRWASYLLGGGSIPALLMLIMHLRERGKWEVFQDSASTAQAKVLGRRKEREISGSGTIVDLFLLFFPQYIYEVVIQFDAIRPSFTVEQVTLKARVSKGFFDRHPPGSTVEVRYAQEDPTVATLEH
jgi:hypothetical protein